MKFARPPSEDLLAKKLSFGVPVASAADRFVRLVAALPLAGFSAEAVLLPGGTWSSQSSLAQ